MKNEAVRLAPSGPGCYLFVRGAEVLYIGEAKNIRRRLSTGHPWAHLLKEGAELQYVECANHKEVERWLIADLAPSLNGKPPSSIKAWSAAKKRIDATGKTLDQRWSEAYAALFGQG